jgi:hypothetical protein
MICIAAPGCVGNRPDLAVQTMMRTELLFAEDFPDTCRWVSELENGGSVRASAGALEIDVPGGCTVWLAQRLEGPLLIEYDATVIVAGGPNDRLSDLNCFWMASDIRTPDDLFKTRRSGKFADYNQLLAYYVGVGGNSNTTTRFRRYIGDRELRPLLPEHDLTMKDDLLEANRTYHIRLVASGSTIQFWRDGRKLFEMIDPKPYTSGHFGFRTVSSHLQFRNFRVYRLAPR